MYNIVIYCNCHGVIYKYLFDKYFPQCNIKLLANFPISNDNFKFNINQKLIFQNADLFIYNPMNKDWKSEKNINYVKTLLKPSCKCIKVAYYRFDGFYIDYKYETNLKGVINNNYNYYNFHDDFLNSLKKFKELDEKMSDIKMYQYFINNYKTTKLFVDSRHLSPIFFYNIFISMCKHVNINIHINYNQKVFEDLKNYYYDKNVNMDKFSINISNNIKNYLKLKYN